MSWAGNDIRDRIAVTTEGKHRKVAERRVNDHLLAVIPQVQ